MSASFWTSLLALAVLLLLVGLSRFGPCRWLFRPRSASLRRRPFWVLLVDVLASYWPSPGFGRLDSASCYVGLFLACKILMMSRWLSAQNTTEVNLDQAVPLWNASTSSAKVCDRHHVRNRNGLRNEGEWSASNPFAKSTTTWRIACGEMC